MKFNTHDDSLHMPVLWVVMAILGPSFLALFLVAKFADILQADEPWFSLTNLMVVGINFFVISFCGYVAAVGLFFLRLPLIETENDGETFVFRPICAPWRSARIRRNLIRHISLNGEEGLTDSANILELHGSQHSERFIIQLRKVFKVESNRLTFFLGGALRFHRIKGILDLQNLKSLETNGIDRDSRKRNEQI